MKTYVFKVVLEEDPFEDGRMAYHVYIPALPGCFSWGYTQEEALKNIQEVAELWIKDMMEAGERIPVEVIEEGKEKQKLVFSTPLVAVTI